VRQPVSGNLEGVNALAISALLASLLILVIGVSVLLRDRRRRTHTAFAAFTFMVSAWHLCNFVAMATNSPLVRWLALWPAATIVPTALAFFREFLAQPAIGGKRRPPRVTLAWTIAAYVALIYSAIVHRIHESLWFQIPFGIYVYGGLYRCVYDMYVQYRGTIKQVERVRLRYLMLGGFVATTLSLTDVLPRFVEAWPTIGNVFTIVYLYFLSETLLRVIHVNELIGKMAVLGTLVALLWAVYGFLLTWIGGGQEGLFLLNALVASFVIFILYEPVRKRLESGINRWIMRQRVELRGRIDKLRRELIRVTDVDDMAARIVSALEESRRATHASVYLLDSAGTGFDLKGFYGSAPIERVENANHREFLERLRQDDKYLDLELIRRELYAAEAEGGSDAHMAALEALIQQLEEMNATLVFPMFGSADTEQGPWLLGLLAIRDKRVDSAFDSEDIALFRQLAKQAANTIEASQQFARVKERERLAAIGEMATGLAHEIRNPLGAIKGAAQLLVGPDGQLDTSPESGDFLRIIIEEVDRLNNVVLRFLDYARMETRAPAERDAVDINDVVRKTVQLLQNDDAAQNAEIQVRLDDLIPPVAGDAELLVQVFLNLGINALQAMADTGGTLEIITTRRRRSPLGYGSFAEVRFRDTGVGIPPEKLDDLFVPFFTTKTRGTGLGLAISQRIVSQHGGTIEVRSNPGKGSTFSVFFPALGPSLPAHSADDSVEIAALAPAGTVNAPAPPADDTPLVAES
jgi:two-component system, NtrC family, sensor histidine kinase HydH